VAELGTVTEIVAEAEAPDATATDDGLTLTVHPVGADTVRATVPLKLLSDVTVTVEVPEKPA